MEGSDAKVDALKAIVDVVERRRHSLGRRGGNGRADAKVDAVKPPKPRRGMGLLDRATHRG